MRDVTCAACNTVAIRGLSIFFAAMQPQDMALMYAMPDMVSISLVVRQCQCWLTLLRGQWHIDYTLHQQSEDAEKGRGGHGNRNRHKATHSRRVSATV